MKHKTWFRLVLKVVGIYLVAQGLATVADAGANMAGGLNSVMMRGGGAIWGGGLDLEMVIAVGISFGLAGAIVQIAIGACLLLAAGPIARWIIPSNRPYCPDCGHELRGLSGVNCPECGVRLPGDLLPPAGSGAESEPPAPELSLPRVLEPMRRFIPVGNRKALSAYYVAIASLIPGVGLVLGPIAVAFGVEALRYARRHPAARGRAHAWTGVVIGVITTVGNVGSLCLLPRWLLM